jgi:hypothetical protein
VVVEDARDLPAARSRQHRTSEHISYVAADIGVEVYLGRALWFRAWILVSRDFHPDLPSCSAKLTLTPIPSLISLAFGIFQTRLPSALHGPYMIG